MMNRRSFAALGAAAGLVACTLRAPEPVARAAVEPVVFPPLPSFYGAIRDEPFPIAAIPEGSVAPDYWRQEVVNPWPGHARGTIVVDPDAALLHFVMTPATAMRYGASVGAEGFAWAGTARLQFTREWPRWNVPDTMIARKPELEPYSVANGGMAGGLDNPLGARALYLFQDGVDTLYRIHGNAAPQELGHAVSSGCIRMLDHDVIDLHARSVHGAAVIVLPSIRPVALAQVY